LTDGNQTAEGMAKPRISSNRESKGSKVPAYIVTFSDMVTLLLTFFVMLLSLAKVQDPELFSKGRDSFWESIKNCGLGMLLGKRSSIDFDQIKRVYFIEDPNNESKTRGIDEQRKKLRQAFERISRSMTTLPSQIVAEKANFMVTNIRFSQGEAILDESAKKFLMEFCSSLQASKTNLAETLNVYSNTGIDPCKSGILYVLGLGDNTYSSPSREHQESLVKQQVTEKEQWILSANRAQAVADFLEAILSASGGWHVYSWGAGSGGQWVGTDSPISRQSQILIAVLQD
jgi:outer membrane protein OmpA-like peptidoglycan-associated protein